MAHEAATDRPSGAGGVPGRPNTTRAASRRRTVQIHNPSGQQSSHSAWSADTLDAMSISPSGNSVDKAAPGRKAHGRRAARASSEGVGDRQGRNESESNA